MNLPVRLVDVLCLLDHVIQGKSHPEVGFEDIERTFGQIKAALDKEVHLEKETLESALWSAGLMDEAGQFRHPDGISYQQMVNRIVPPTHKFDYVYHTINRKLTNEL